MTQTGYGAGVESVILSWVFMTLSICWVLSILFFDHLWVPLVLQAIAFPFILALLALAFRTSEKGNPLLQYPRAKVIGYDNLDEKYAEACDLNVMYIDYKNITKVIEVGKNIYVDDGVLSFKVLEVHDDFVKVRAINNGKLCSKKGVNLPDTDVDLPAVSEKDKNDLLFGAKNEVDMVFASFIRQAQDIKDIRQILGGDGCGIKIIAKIENQQGVNNFDEILKEADGIMVARGDLGIEIPASQVFVAQKMMIAKCNLAEVSDVANAVLDGADCVMLSGETAKGSYPIEAAESAICYPPLFHQLRVLTPLPLETAEAVACAAVTAANETHAVNETRWQEDVENRIQWGMSLAVTHKYVAPCFNVTLN
ncbi:6437_t:CDS:2 [Racocetra fulgida]|uniref:Pyruvate kinase n=1 Tax=Racocetra fulgida TaxID=60492 RepID=A0A9N8VGA3_9GLOM|nr:6437_t:CDS:2 [Racocetra fulgida]